MCSANEDEEGETHSSTVMDGQRQVQLEALDHEIEYNELLISEREGEIQNIEQGITELNEIFRDMGMLVNEQESGIRKYCNYTVLFYLAHLHNCVLREHLRQRFKHRTKYKVSR